MPKTIPVYSYHPDSLEYLGDTVADESPLEAGVFHIPAHATKVAPPAAIEGKSRHFNGSRWEYRDIEIPDPDNETQEG